MVKACNDWGIDYYPRIGNLFHITIGTFPSIPNKKRWKDKEEDTNEVPT